MGLCEESVFLLLLPPYGRQVVWSWKNGNGSSIRIPGSMSPRSDCFVELANVFAAAITIIASIILIVKYKCKYYKKLTKRLLPLHTIRTIICIVLLIFVLFEFCESLLIFAPLSPALSILSVIFCWVVHRQTEMRDGFGLFITGGGFTIIAIARIWKFFYLRTFDLTISHIQIITTAGTAASCGLLAIMDAYTFNQMMIKKNKISMKSTENFYSSYEHASSTFLSKITFHWVISLLARGNHTTLDFRDLGKLPEEESSKILFEKFQNIYKNEKELKGKDKLSLWICYWKHVWLPFTIGGLLKLLGDVSNLVGPIAISKMIDYVSISQNATFNYWKFEHSRFVTVDQFFQNGYILGLLVFFASILQSTLSQSSTHILNVEGIRLKTALQASVYDKALRLCSWNISEEEKPSAKETDENACQNFDIGTLTNLMAEDAYNVMGFFWIGHYIWAIPVKISAIIFLLHLKLGISAIIGAVCCILTVTPMTLYLGKRISNNSICITEKSDSRLRLINEILQGMRVVKLRAWEELFEKKIGYTRNRELQLLNKDSLFWTFINFLTHSSSVLTTLFTFGIYFWMEEKNLDAGSVFASLALFSQLTVPLFIFPVIIPIIINAVISTKRLESFLSLPETINVLPKVKERNFQIQERCVSSNDSNVETTNVQNVFGHLDDIEEYEEDYFLKKNSASNSIVNTSLKKGEKPVNFAVKVNGTFSWGSSDTQLMLKELTFPRGKLSLIVGKIGSGKTSLVSAILGEMQKVRGKVEWARDSRVAYVSQKPWLINATLRDNILFGMEFRPRKYRHVLKICALQPDVDILPGRDLTMIGEKGINLSGGQKQRIAIARAIYSECDTIILDDPLSALDQPVGHQIFEQGIQKLLLRKYTIIMITHRLELLPFADQIVAMDFCQIRAVGTKINIEKTDSALAAEWREAVKRKVNDHQVQKTAKDRWSLIRLISRISISIRQRNSIDGSWIIDQDAHVTPPVFVPLRLRRSTLLGSRYLAHDLSDILVSAEEWDAIVRRKSKKHRVVIRATSLQPLKRPPPILRQISTPTILEACYVPSRKRHNTLEGSQTNNMLKQIFSGRVINPNSEEANLSREKSILRRLMASNQNKINSNQEYDPRPIKRLLSEESATFQNNEDEEKVNDILVEEDSLEDESGRLVTTKVWLTYFKIGGILPSIIYIFTALGCQVIRVYTDLWLSRWTEHNRGTENTKNNRQNMIFYCRVYIILSICSIVLYAICNGIGQWVGARARCQLHYDAIQGLLRAPLSYFHQTPIGKILNRFSADIGVIDKKLSIAIQRLTFFFLLCASAIFVNIAISPWFLIPAIPICGVYYFLQRFYRYGARELQRLDGSSRGPLSAHFSETLSGLPTIRASRQQNRFINQMFYHLDVNTNAFLILNTSSRWLGIVLDYLGAVIVIGSIFACLISAKSYPHQITPALVGLAINYTFLVPIYLNWVVKFISEIEMYMGSVQRISFFANIPPENQDTSFDQVIPSDWPKIGAIVFDNVSLRYDLQQEPVVTNLDLVIPTGMRLGICGRTGSGKSTTAMAFFRLVDICQGRIIIDGIDIQKVPLHILRSRLSIIPQDVIIFSGTIRENLDPFSQYTDYELWSALELAQIKDVVSSHPDGLNLEVREGGENFSAGQLQLINMARAVLIKSSVIIFDEATSALDASTEKALLKTAAVAFKKKVIITIAHRVASLLACDRILVFDDGKIVEDGSPKELIQHPMGFFSTMLRATENVDSIL
ncbi:ATP-binding cassette sub-family C member Sur-like isoform X2 [Leptopilina boulardi]|uniref:ATP-binding cassette sub-family C member Sur-like isoform X2 n=1 Tax=Leptopilina boulardi TaxID=63433 RepID=UPI0021F5A697|nr:ATP-binding cassette sub-family C member Sur-like isoform X2 [Leptopilina boulardi]